LDQPPQGRRHHAGTQALENAAEKPLLASLRVEKPSARKNALGEACEPGGRSSRPPFLSQERQKVIQPDQRAVIAAATWEREQDENAGCGKREPGRSG
jgi:hypothetical protein